MPDDDYDDHHDVHVEDDHDVCSLYHVLCSHGMRGENKNVQGIRHPNRTEQ